MNNLNLIKSVKQFPILYNGEKSIFWKNKAWDMVATKMGKSVIDVKKRWSSIRDSFSKRYNERITGTTKKRCTTYERFDEDLEFLIPFLSCGGINSNTKDESVEEGADSDDNDAIDLLDDSCEEKTPNKKIEEQKDEEILLSDKESVKGSENESKNQEETDLFNTEEVKTMLIDEVRKYPVIYDVRLGGHSDRTAVDNAWRKIAMELNTQPSLCMDLWAQMRNEYMKNVKPVEGTGKEATKKKDLDRRLDFLRISKIERPTKTSLKLESKITPNNSLETIKIIPDTASERPKNVKRRRTKTEILLQEMEQSRKSFFGEFKNLCESDKEIKKIDDEVDRKIDDISMFFSTVESQTRQLPKPMQAELKKKILNAVSEVEARSYGLPQWNVHPTPFGGFGGSFNGNPGAFCGLVPPTPYGGFGGPFNGNPGALYKGPFGNEASLRRSPGTPYDSSFGNGASYRRSPVASYGSSLGNGASYRRSPVASYGSPLGNGASQRKSPGASYRKSPKPYYGADSPTSDFDYSNDY